MQQLDGTVIATALPQMARTFARTPVAVSTGVTAYLLTLAVFIPSSSWAADRFGSKPIFGGAILLFTIGSVLCGLSNSLLAFVAARIVQAIGGAMMLPVGRLVVLRTAEKHELLSTMQFITIPGLIAPVLGPALGGFITTYTSWRWIFYLNVPIGIAGFALVWIFFANDRVNVRKPFDTVGFLLSGFGLSAAMYGFTSLGQKGAPPLLTTGSIALGLATMALAIRHGRRHPTPLVDLSALHVPTFVLSTLTAGGLYRMTIGAMPFLWPLMFQIGFGYNPFVSGLLVTACTSGDLGAQLFVRSLLRKLGFRFVMIVAAFATAAFALACALFTASTPPILILAVLAVIGVLRSCEFTAMNTLAYSDIETNVMSAASTLASTAQQLNVGLGVAFAALTLNVIAIATGETGQTLRAGDFRLAFVVVGVLGVLATLLFLRLPRNAGVAMIRRVRA